MNVLSLFDGISVAQIALNKVGIKYENYYASEIDAYAKSITQKNYPNTIQVGDVTKVNGSELPKIDLLVGGSPCQDLSIAKGKREGLSGTRSSLFYEPNDLGLTVRHIIDVTKQRKYLSPKNVIKSKRGVKWDTSGKGYYSQQDRAYSILGKFPTIPTARTITKLNVLFEDGSIGVLNWHEAERLQCIPDDYTDLGVGNRVEKRGAVIGNCFNVDVMAHILKSIK
jgi:site-specific DNA-cytosine methylase